MWPDIILVTDNFNPAALQFYIAMLTFHIWSEWATWHIYSLMSLYSLLLAIG